MTTTPVAGATAPATGPSADHISTAQNHTTGGTRMTANLPAHYQPQVLAAQMDYARALAESNLLPKQYFKQPANLLWAISYGQTLGVDPMTAVQSIHVINGRPTASADLIAGLVRRAGHKLRITGDDRRAEAVIIRADDPEFEFRAVWTIERAQAAKLTGKDTWKQFPAAMLKARAITEVARAACSEILQGTIYTPEELGAVVDQDGNPVDAHVQPLRAVQAEPVEEPASVAGDGRTPAQVVADKATETSSLAEWRGQWAIAKTGRQLDTQVTAPDTGEQCTLRAYLTRRGTALKEAEQTTAPAEEQPLAEEQVVDAEIVPSEEDDHARAESELRAVAGVAGIADFDAAAEQALGLPIEQASADAIRGLTEQIASTHTAA